ncbi:MULTISPECIES: NAD(P)-binding domain-containing protein [unclassified Streptomyces]|uniref:NAD(P)-dependent oxidoreductase n=1 Tax=unclassified Streptomyces TaxID=2593676 RepID=UPI002DDC7BB0|nr:MULTISPECIES: NAD(P)-binding domain-containing protein [unclassified Streptomyces]WSA91593.1 NAD(P)-binding domain-containing protein [Streptomyces sp. NBC_01795]WSB75963.1 NAD(P)-binding domain-containing protein [Streptomyces sp. NBC_01775]WSS44600.1 NAD(P)-binding domain-containing protein [Streptomyces sp. NBC_01187]
MDTHTSSANPVTLLGLGDMGTALARAWLAAGHPLTVWNRTPAKTAPLAAEGARVAATPAEAVAAATGPVVLCLLDDASVGETLDGADLSGKDLVNLTTSTPAQARARARWAEERGARFLDGGIMAVPPMIGHPESGGYVFYSGDRPLHERHRATLEVPAGARYVGEDAGHAALYDIALLSAMTGMFGGVTHAFALVRPEKDLDQAAFATSLAEWLGAMAGIAHGIAAQLESGDLTKGVTSNLAMMTTGNRTLLATARDQSVDSRLLDPFMELMRHRVEQGHGDEGLAGLTGLLRTDGAG